MISRIADDREYRYQSATMMAAMLYLLKGIPFIYQGQEIGITSSHYDSIDCFDDVESINTYRELCGKMSAEKALEKINFGSRDNARHPMPWDDSAQGGFTAGTPWMALYSRHKEINVKRDLASEQSVYRFCQKLLRLRKTHDAFLDGSFQVLSAVNDPCFIYTRTLNDETWVVVCNFESEREITLPFTCDPPVLSNMNRPGINGKYGPYECAAAQVRADD